MSYTVQKLANLAGVSVRTLHHYDEIGILKPSYVAENGYRYYEEKELMLLQQILFFKELEFPLDQIKAIVQSKNFDVLEALKSQQKLLQMERKRLDTLLITIDKTITSMKTKQKLTDEELYEGFPKDQIEEIKKEAQDRWGNTDAYKQSQERVANWTKEDLARIKEEGEKITQSIADTMDKGPQSKEVQDLIQSHFKYMQNFYECSYQMYRGLGNMYVQDKRFTATYEKYKPGLAQFMHEAMDFFCDQHEK